jgi:hypothetical protein
MQRRRLPLGFLLRLTWHVVVLGEALNTILQEKRKEAISWRMLFPVVASVVKVI